MNRTDINIADNTLVTLTKTNGNTVVGTVFRVRDKSITITDPDTGTNTHITLAHVASVVPVTEAELLTTAELAVIFDTNAKALRVELRRLGLGVGKGSRYGLPASIVTIHGDAIRAGLADRKTA